MEDGKLEEAHSYFPVRLKIAHLMYTTGWTWETLMRRTPKHVLDEYLLVSSIHAEVRSERMAMAEAGRARF